MNNCEDCGMINPPDDHVCQQYEDRIKKEKAARSIEETVQELEYRIEELERRLASVSIQQLSYSPWRK